MAPPGLSDDDTQKWVDAITEMHDSDAWKKALEDQRLDRRLHHRRRVQQFLDDESDRVESVMSELGLV